MSMKNNRAAEKILQLEPQAAEQYDTRGRNFLHTAILKGDLESVLFLISIQVRFFKIFMAIIKGQLISECLLGVINFPKTNEKFDKFMP